MAQPRLRRLVDPGIAWMAFAPDHHVIELHAMRTFEVLRGFFGLFEPLGPHGRTREIIVACRGDNILALRDHVAVENSLHVFLADRIVPAPGRSCGAALSQRRSQKNHPRNPLVAMPFMMWLRNSANTISIGRMLLTAPAEIGPYSMKNWR